MESGVPTRITVFSQVVVTIGVKIITMAAVVSTFSDPMSYTVRIVIDTPDMVRSRDFVDRVKQNKLPRYSIETLVRYAFAVDIEDTTTELFNIYARSIRKVNDNMLVVDVEASDKDEALDYVKGVCRQYHLPVRVCRFQPKQSLVTNAEHDDTDAMYAHMMRLKDSADPFVIEVIEDSQSQRVSTDNELDKLIADSEMTEEDCVVSVVPATSSNNSNRAMVQKTSPILTGLLTMTKGGERRMKHILKKF